MDAWAHQPGFPLVTLRIAGQDGNAADDDSDDDDDDQGPSSAAPLRLTAQQVVVVGMQRTFAAVLTALFKQRQRRDTGDTGHALRMQETFASGQQLACGGSSDGSTRRPWWVPLAHITGGASGDEVSPASWVVLDACSTGVVCQDTTCTETYSVALKDGVMDDHLHRHAADARFSS